MKNGIIKKKNYLKGIIYVIRNEIMMPVAWKFGKGAEGTIQGKKRNNVVMASRVLSKFIYVVQIFTIYECSSSINYHRLYLNISSKILSKFYFSIPNIFYWSLYFIKIFDEIKGQKYISNLEIIINLDN